MTEARLIAPDDGFRLALPAGIVERIADLAAERVLAQLDARERSPYVSVAEAADILRAKPQRVYDLLSARRLTRYRDGARVLVSRAELDDYLAGTKRRTA